MNLIEVIANALKAFLHVSGRLTQYAFNPENPNMASCFPLRREGQKLVTEILFLEGNVT